MASTIFSHSGRRKILSLDSVGVCASTLCLFHCLAFPVAFTVLPVLQANQPPRMAAAERDQFPWNRVDSRFWTNLHQTSTGLQETNQGDWCCTGSPFGFWIHAGLLGAVAPIGMMALFTGYRQHRKTWILLLGGIGIALLASALLWGMDLLDGRGERVLTMLGSVGLVIAHLANRRQSASSPCCRVPPVNIEGVCEEATVPKMEISQDSLFGDRKFDRVTNPAAPFPEGLERTSLGFFAHPFGRERA